MYMNVGYSIALMMFFKTRKIIRAEGPVLRERPCTQERGGGDTAQLKPETDISAEAHLPHVFYHTTLSLILQGFSSDFA